MHESNQAKVVRNGKTTVVKNLGWLIRNYGLVSHFEIRSGVDGYDLHIRAILRDGSGYYETGYASAAIFHRFVCRAFFCDLRLDYFGCSWDGNAFQSFGHVTNYTNSWRVGYYAYGTQGNPRRHGRATARYSLSYCGRASEGRYA